MCDQKNKNSKNSLKMLATVNFYFTKMHLQNLMFCQIDKYIFLQVIITIVISGKKAKLTNFQLLDVVNERIFL